MASVFVSTVLLFETLGKCDLETPIFHPPTIQGATMSWEPKTTSSLPRTEQPGQLWDIVLVPKCHPHKPLRSQPPLQGILGHALSTQLQGLRCHRQAVNGLALLLQPPLWSKVPTVLWGQLWPGTPHKQSQAKRCRCLNTQLILICKRLNLNKYAPWLPPYNALNQWTLNTMEYLRSLYIIRRSFPFVDLFHFSRAFTYTWKHCMLFVFRTLHTQVLCFYLPMTSRRTPARFMKAGMHGFPLLTRVWHTVGFCHLVCGSWESLQDVDCCSNFKSP